MMLKLGLLWAVYAAVNLIAFVLYGLDKRRAKKGAWRIPERTLLLWTWLMGGLGAKLGMQCFRHKTCHRAFIWSVRIALPIQLVLMLLATYGLFGI